MWFLYLVEVTVMLIVKFLAIVVVTPVFMIPAIVVFAAGSVMGQIYIKAQMSVKREMSNAKAPVLSHFGAAIGGLSELICPSSSFYLGIDLWLTSVNPRVFRSKPIHRRVFETHRSILADLADVLQLESMDMHSGGRLGRTIRECAGYVSRLLRAWNRRDGCLHNGL